MLSTFVTMLALTQAGQSELPALPNHAVARIERTGCYGTCPSYKVTVFDDGQVEWEGQQYVKAKGRATAKLTADELKALIAAFEEFHFLDLPDHFNCKEVTDNPSVFLSYRSNERTRLLQHYQGCRRPAGAKELTAFEDKVDKLLHTERWVGGHAPRP